MSAFERTSLSSSLAGPGRLLGHSTRVRGGTAVASAARDARADERAGMKIIATVNAIAAPTIRIMALRSAMLLSSLTGTCGWNSERYESPPGSLEILESPRDSGWLCRRPDLESMAILISCASRLAPGY